MLRYKGEVMLQQPTHKQSPKCVSPLELPHGVLSDQASRGDAKSLRFAAFPIRGANLVEIEHQFGYTALYVIVQILIVLSRNALGPCKRCSSSGRLWFG
jgi:hypothetical protein